MFTWQTEHSCCCWDALDHFHIQCRSALIHRFQCLSYATTSLNTFRYSFHFITETFFFLTFNQEKTTLYWGPTFFFSTGLMKFRISVALITIQSSLIFKMHSYHSTLDRWDLHYHSGPNIFLCFSLYWLWNSVTFFRDWEEERKGGYWKYTETCALPWLNTSVKQQPCINKGPSSDKQASQDKKH